MFSTDPVDREELTLYGDRMADEVDGDIAQYKCSAHVTVFRTSLCAPDQGFEFARKCCTMLRTLRDQTWGLKSKHPLMVVCCTPGASPVRLESLYVEDSTQELNERTSVSQLEIDEWLFRAETHLSTWSILTESCIVDVETHELRSRGDSTVFILASFDPYIHDMAYRKIQVWLSRDGHRIFSEDTSTIEPLMQLAEYKVSSLTTDPYKEDEFALESLIQWKFQWLKAYYVSLVVNGIINPTAPDMVGKWIGLSVSKSRGPIWNGQFYLDNFDTYDGVMDDPTIDHSAPFVGLEVKLGRPMSFKLNPFEPNPRLINL